MGHFWRGSSGKWVATWGLLSLFSSKIANKNSKGTVYKTAEEAQKEADKQVAEMRAKSKAYAKRQVELLYPDEKE